MKKAIFFDLDNTLFDVSEYYLAAFMDVAKFVEINFNIPKEKSYTFLKQLWNDKTSRYTRLFDDLISEFDIDVNAKKLVDIFNSVNPNLQPYEGVENLLDSLRDNILGIITDGNASRQRRKIKTLFGDNYFNLAIFSSELNSSKASEIPFKLAKARCDGINNFYFIGDNPQVDFEFAKKEGFTTIRLLKGEYKDEECSPDLVDYNIKELSEIKEIVK